MFPVFYRNLRHQITIIKRPTSQILLHFNVFNGGAIVVVQNHQNPFLKSISNISKSTKQQQPSFTVDYLINSCGLPPEKALSAAKKFNLCSIEKADSVISLFQTYGLTKTHITKLISQHPQLLSYDPFKNLKPKFEFLSDLGVSETDFPKLSTSNSRLLTSSLEKVLIPNITTLQVHGVPHYNIVKMLFEDPRSICHDSNSFKEAVEKVKTLGFDPLSPMFYRAVKTIAGLSKSGWDEKLMVYREFGLLESDVISAFKKHPYCMLLSEENIRRCLEFFLRKLKCKPMVISFRPSLLLYSLDKRIIPRCAVLKILYSKGIIENKLALYSVMKMAERDFSDKFVIKYQEKVPKLMNTYKGGIEFEGFGEVVEVKDLYLEPAIDHIPPVVTAV